MAWPAQSTTRKLVLNAALIALAHFALTAVGGYYVGIHVGGQVGTIVANGMIAAMEGKAEPMESVDSMRHQADAIADRWQPVFGVLSFPVKWLLTPVSDRFWRNKLKQVRAHDISQDRLYFEVRLVSLALTLLNSVALGALVFAVLLAMRRYRAP